MSIGPGGGFDVHPDSLRAGAEALRADVQVFDAVGSAASLAIEEASEAGGALARSAVDLASQIDATIDAVRRSVEESADALAAAASNYTATDQSAAGGLGGLMLPGFESPP